MRYSVLFLSFLTACAPVDPPQPAYKADFKPLAGLYCATYIPFSTPKETDEVCRVGTADPSNPNPILGCTRQSKDSPYPTVYYTLPRSWNDYSRFQTLGHEQGHVMGAKHE